MAKRPISPEDLLRIQVPSDPQLSPDGSMAVFSIKAVGDRNSYVSNLWLFRYGEVRQLTFGDSSDSSPRWNPDGTGINFVSNRHKPKSQFLRLPLQGGEAFEISDLPEGSIGRYECSPDGAKIAFLFRERESARAKEAEEEREKTGLSEPPRVIETLQWRMDGDGVFGGERFKLCVLDPSAKKHIVVCDKAKDGEYAFCWTPDSSRLLVGFNSSDNPTMEPWQDELFFVDPCTGEMDPLKGYPIGNKSSLSFSPDGAWAAMAYADRTEDNFGTKNASLCVYNPLSGKWKNLTEGSDYDLQVWTLSDVKEPASEAQLLWSKDSQSIHFNLSLEGATQLCKIGIAGGDIEFLTKEAAELSLGSIAGERIAVVNPTPTSLPEVLIVENGEPAWRSEFNKELLDEIEIAEPEEHWVESEDGTKVQTWVLKPRGDGPFPAAIEVHGGPHGMYTCCFFIEMQVLAANGYVVVFSNPRGSTGYGEEFARCIMGDWGNKDWADVQAVTRFCKSLPYVDPARVAIMGGSYGGYIVNWAIGHTDEYKCAISDRSVSNLLSKSGNSDYTFVPNGNWPGAAYDDWEMLWDKSPVKHFGNAKTPTLVIHSEGDLRCNVEQGDQVYTFLKMKGVPTRYVRYPASTSHGLSRSGPPDLRIHRMNEQLRWFSEYL
ncbi:MAG: S9 family peptidase [Armatimonadetes bacterium]|nr:S9 family peptidase [Armatimonadota bacterium]